MNKKLLLGLGLLLLLGGGYFFMNRSQTPGSSTETGTQTETSTDAESSAPNSLRDLLSVSAAQKCTYASTESGTTNEGTVYVSGGQVRGDFKLTTSGKTSTSNMITDGKTLYLWGSELGGQGLKLTIEGSEAETSPSDTSTTNLDQPVNFNCTAWVVDNSVFTPPSDVNFSDGFNYPGM